MNPRVQRSIDRIAGQARLRYSAWLASARTQTRQAAGRVRDGKKPVKTLSRLGVKLSDVSHRTTSKVLKQQAKLVEHQIDALAVRLHSAARAENLGDLLRTQLRLIPANASQLLTDGREALSIVAGAGSEVRELVAGTVAELRGEKPAAAAKKAAPKPKRAAKKTPAKRKAPARKAAPRKATARKTPAKKITAEAETAAVGTRGVRSAA